MKRIIFSLIAITLLASCSPLITKKQKARYLADNCKAETIIKDSIINNYELKYKIDTFEIAEDSTFLRMWFECDDKNQVILKQLQEYKGKTFTTKVTYEGEILYIKTKIDKQKFLAISKEILRTTYEKNYRDVTKVYTTNKIPKWLWWAFGVVLLLVWFRKVIAKLFI